MIVAIDYETYLISKEMPIPKPVCITWYDGNEQGIYVGKDMEVFLYKVFSDESTTIVAHNLTFELLVTYEYYPELREYIWKKLENKQLKCTQIYERLLSCQSRIESKYQKRSRFLKEQLEKYNINISTKDLTAKITKDDKKFKEYVKSKATDKALASQILEHTLLKSRQGTSLADLVIKYFDENIFDDKKNPNAWRLRYSELDGIPLEEWPQEAIDYAIGDSIYTYDAYKKQKATLEVKDHNVVTSGFCLNLMASRGMLVDKNRVELLKSEVTKLLEEPRKVLINKGFMAEREDGKFSKKMKDVRDYITSNFNRILYTEKGVVSTSTESLDEYLVEKEDKIIKALKDVMEYEKVTGFIENLLEADPEIRTQYNPCVNTGRTSSSRSSAYPSVNIQQMPREVKKVTWDIRNCFVPRPGFKIVSIDYNGLELASTAHQLHILYPNISRMRDTVNYGDKPVDMHSKLACQLKSIRDNRFVTYEEFVENKKKEGYKEVRQLAKPVNLGFPGGIGYDTMRSLILKEGITTKLKTYYKGPYEKQMQWLLMKFINKNPYLRVRRTGKREWALVYDELKKLKSEMFKLYPELKLFLTEGHTQFQTGEKIKLFDEWGDLKEEEMYFYNIYGFTRNWATYTALCNGYLMQSPSAVGAKNMMNAVIKKYIEHPDMNPLAFIHDEIVFEVRENENMYDIVKDVSEIMIDEMQKVLYTVRIAVEADIMDYWKKSGGFWTKTFWKNIKDNILYED